MTASRLAILVGDNQMSGTPLHGVTHDIQRMKNFLLSNNGGAWTSDEIIVVDYPTSENKLQTGIQEKTSQCNYTLFYFAGHGYVSRQDSDTYICVGDNEEVNVRRLRISSDKQLVIIDACREYYDTEKIAKSMVLDESLADLLPSDYRLRCRVLYEVCIQAAGGGTSRIYSCSEGEAAGEGRQGGYFTRELLDSTNDWIRQSVDNNSQDMRLLIPDAFSLAYEDVKIQGQTPVLENGRRIMSFPFAVAPPT